MYQCFISENHVFLHCNRKRECFERRCRMKKLGTIIMVMVMVLMMSQTAFAAADESPIPPAARATRAASSSTDMDGKGTLFSDTGVYDNGSYKWCNSQAYSDIKVTRIRAKVLACYSSTGVQIGSEETSGWISNANYAQTPDFEMDNIVNTQTGKADGFLNTRVTAYGTADAVIS